MKEIEFNFLDSQNDQTQFYKTVSFYHSGDQVHLNVQICLQIIYQFDYGNI